MYRQIERCFMHVPLLGALEHTAEHFSTRDLYFFRQTAINEPIVAQEAPGPSSKHNP